MPRVAQRTNNHTRGKSQKTEKVGENVPPFSLCPGSRCSTHSGAQLHLALEVRQRPTPFSVSPSVPKPPPDEICERRGV